MRTALCLCGLVGGDKGKAGSGSSSEILRIGHKHYNQNLITPNNADVFVHTWTVDKKESIEEMYSPKSSIYEPQIQFDIPKYVKGTAVRKNNHYSKWYSIAKSIGLKSEYEKENNFTYDWVIVARFDIALNTVFDFGQLDNTKFYAGHWCEILDKKGTDVLRGGRGSLYDLLKTKKLSDFSHKHKGFPHTNEGLIDQWFLGNSKDMDKFSNLYNRLDDYTKPGKCPTDSADTISNHRLSLYHLEETGLADRLEFAYHLHDDFPLVRRRFLNCKL